MERWQEKLMARHALAPEDVRHLAELGEVRHYAAGEHVVRMGEVDDRIFILTSGIWRDYCFSDGEEATIWFDVAGEITFSIWGYVNREPSRLSIESITDSEAICIRRSVLEDQFSRSLRFANLGRKIIENFAVLYERWHMEMWRKSAMDRYLILMDEYPEVVGTIPMKYIASYLGVTAQSLSRIRANVMNRR